MGAEQLAQAAGGYHLRSASQLCHHAFQNAFHQSQIPVEQAGLHAGNRVRADDMRRRRISTRGRRAVCSNRASAEMPTPGAIAPPRYAPSAGRIEGGRRAEVHYDAWATVFMDRGHGIHDAVGAHFGGIVV